jgi:adenylate kinase family enzyme
MKRAVIIGNSGGGKSTLARRLSSAWRSPHVEIDALLWQPGWQLTSADIYNTEHARLIAEENWIIDGLGRLTASRRDYRERPISYSSTCRCGYTSGLPPNGK